jgi:hypothetical protein
MWCLYGLKTTGHFVALIDFADSKRKKSPPAHIIIYIMAIRLDGSNTVYWNGQSSLLVFLWHECTSKGITTIKALFTDGKVDD